MLINFPNLKLLFVVYNIVNIEYLSNFMQDLSSIYFCELRATAMYKIRENTANLR